MSERKAKRERKGQPVQTVKKQKSNVLFNIIITVVILAVVALGVWAVYPSIKDGNSQVVEDSLEQQKLGVVAEEMGTTAKEIISTYQLEEYGFNEESNIIEVTSKMTVENYAKFEGITPDELKAEFKYTDDVTLDMTMEQAQDYMPVENIVMGTGTDYATFISAYGLTVEDLPPETLYKDAFPVLQAAQEKLMEEQMANQMTQDGVEVGNVDVSVGE